MPYGGWRDGRGRPRDLRLQARPERVGEIFTKYRKTHNDGVFDAYTPDDPRPRARRGIITGLPDAYGRGRIIGDYRRVALYGVDCLIADKQRENGRAGRPRTRPRT